MQQITLKVREIFSVRDSSFRSLILEAPAVVCYKLIAEVQYNSWLGVINKLSVSVYDSLILSTLIG